MKSTKSKGGTDAAFDVASDLFEQQIALTREMFGAFSGFAREIMPGLDRIGKGSCDIPEPCWMPKDLGEFHCALCPGSTGILEITITNTDFRARAFTILAAGPDASRITIAPGGFTLGPKERRKVRVQFDTRLDQGVTCAELEALIWVTGCNSHFLRWCIDVGKHESVCCHSVEVLDQPDYVHHWYDHFYCDRPCFGRAVRPQSDQPNVKG